MGKLAQFGPNVPGEGGRTHLRRYALQAHYPAHYQGKRCSHVANIKSQKKRILTNAKAADRNKAIKSELRTRVKNAVKAARQR